MVIRKHKERSERERGAEIVELVFVYPLAIILIFSIVQLGFMAFSTLTMTNAMEAAAMNVDCDALYRTVVEENDQAEAQEILTKAIKAENPAWSSDIKVSLADGHSSYFEPAYTDHTGQPSYMTYDATPVDNNNKIYVDYDDGSRGQYWIADFYRETRAGEVAFKVTYEIPSLLNIPGLAHMTTSRDIVRERVVTSRVEVR